MTQLVFIENGKMVTDSLTVAEVFGKDHDNVLRDIQSMECSEEFSLLNFEESTYTNKRGRTYLKYIITQSGFVMLAMGYTGKDAMRFKEDYIREFDRMKEEQESNRLPMNIKPSPELRAIFMLDEKQQEFEQRIERIENNSTIDYGQQNDLRKIGSQRVVELFGGTDSAAYADKTLKRQAFSALWNEYKDRFNVNSRNNTRIGDFEKATEYVKSWALPGKIERQVEDHNRQGRIF